MFTEEEFRRTPVTLTIVAVAGAIELALTLVSLADPQAETELRIKYYGDFRLGVWAEIWMSHWCRATFGTWWPTWLGEWWRPFTTTLLHGNLLHAFFNISATLIFGRPIEEWLGSLRYLGLILLLAYVSSLAEYAIWPLIGPLLVFEAKPIGGLVGFSGVGYGLFGFVWACRNYRPDFMEACPDQRVQWMMGWFLGFVVLTSLKLFPVANVAHAAGLGLGLVIGLALVEKKQQLQWTIVATAISLAVLSTLLYCPWHPHWRW